MAKHTILLLIAGTIIGIGGAAVMTLGPELWPNAKTAYFWTGTSLMGGGCLMLAFASGSIRKAKARQNDQHIAGGIHISSSNQSGGITAHTVNVGQQRRDLHSANCADLRQQIVRELPRDKVINVTTVTTDSECFDFATQITEFLKANGFNVGPQSHSLVLGSVKGLQVDQSGSEVTFYVAPE